MARHGYHSYESGGIPMGHLPRRRPMGMDPNYRGDVYGGQRMHRGDDRAAYGRYRMEHGRELDRFGGPRGRNTGAGQLREFGPTRPTGPEPMVHGRRGGRGPRGIPERSDIAFRRTEARLRAESQRPPFPGYGGRTPDRGIRMGSPGDGDAGPRGRGRGGNRYDDGFGRSGGSRNGEFRGFRG
jgi:hypothetical protein